MPTDSQPVLRLADIEIDALLHLLKKFGIELVRCHPYDEIPGSFWGDDEAGLILNRVYARPDTPIHSILHEVSHYICMDSDRRRKLNTNAGSNNLEESAVCYLQIMLADDLPTLGRARIFADMDAWGYSFRLGSTESWFKKDAEDARQWLTGFHLLDDRGTTYKIRDQGL